MRRRLFTLLSAASLVLCVATCVLWVRSYVTPDGWSWSDGVRVPTAGYQIAWRKVLMARRGQVIFFMERNMGGVAHSSRIGDAAGELDYRLYYAPPAGPGGVGWRALGFEHFSHYGYPMIASTRFGPPVELTRTWVVPLWAVALAAAVPPAWWLAARRRRRPRPGRCPACGYDLRASPGRCPECGAEPSAAKGVT